MTREEARAIVEAHRPILREKRYDIDGIIDDLVNGRDWESEKDDILKWNRWTT